MKRRRANFWLKDFVYKNISLSSYFLLKQEEKVFIAMTGKKERRSSQSINVKSHTLMMRLLVKPVTVIQCSHM
jgi:hypothetical protein